MVETLRLDQLTLLIWRSPFGHALLGLSSSLGLGLAMGDRAIAQVNLQAFPQAATQSQYLSQTPPPLEPTLNTPPPQTNSEEEEEITVTAQKREQRAKDVPTTLSTFDDKTIQDYQINSLPDLTAKVPNFTIAPSSSGRIFTFYGLRGLNNANFLSRKDIASFYVDDIPFDYGSFLDFDLVDVDRIEVLRGPQSTLYGRNSQAGVINIYSNPPSNKQEIKLGASYSSFNSKNFSIVLSDALVPDKLKFRIVGNYRDNDGLFRNTFLNQDAGAQKEVNARGELFWKPNPNLEVTLRGGGIFIEDGDQIYSTVRAAKPYEIRYNRAGKIVMETGTQALKIAHKTPSFDIISITTHRASKQDGRDTEADYTEFDLFAADYRFKFDNWTQELRLQSGKPDARVKWLLGGYFESNKSIVDGEGFSIIGSGKDLIFAETNTRTFALFSQVDVQIAQPLTLSAGLRYETNRNKLENRKRLFVPEGSTVGVPSGLAIADQVNTDSAVLPKVSLLYQFSPNVAGYASIGRGYKPGGFNYRADTLESLVFRPEKSWNYEVGLKSSFFDNRLAANFAAFTTSLNNYQVILPGPDGFFRNITNAEVGIKGLELELVGKPATGWQLNASLGLLDSDFKQYRNPFTGQDFSGNRLVYAPSLTYNVGVQYRNPAGWFGRMEVQGFGTTFFDDANQLKQKPYALLNGRIGYENERYGVYAFANNILGTEYLTSAFVFPPPNIIGSYGERRTFGVQVKANF